MLCVLSVPPTYWSWKPEITGGVRAGNLNPSRFVMALIAAVIFLLKNLPWQKKLKSDYAVAKRAAKSHFAMALTKLWKHRPLQIN
jgi:hypothetical protein